MTPQEARSLQENEFLFFTRNPGRTGKFIRTVENGNELYIEIQEIHGNSVVNCEELSQLSDSVSIEDKIKSSEYARSEQLRQNLVFQKLCGRLAEVIYSMEATNTDFMAYQYKPVLKMLDSPGKGILIADEVGLGKTIEAGLIWTELKARFDMSRLLVVCPASLRKKWVQELSDRFQCDALECKGSKELLEVMESGLARNKGISAVCSYQTFLPPQKSDEDLDKETIPSTGKQKLREFIQEKSEDGQSAIDLLIIDEAHYLRNKDNKTSKGIRALMEICEHVLLLSATPIHLKSGNLFSLLNILDENYFENEAVFSQMVAANQPIVQAIREYPPGNLNIQQFQENVSRALESGFFENNQYLQQALSLSGEQRDWSESKPRQELLDPLNKANLFNQYIVRNRKRDVIQERPIRRVEEIWIEPTLAESAFYEKLLDAIYDYASDSGMNSPGFLLATPERMFSSSIPATLEGWKSARKEFLVEMESNEGQKESNIGPLTLHLAESFSDYEISTLLESDSKAEALILLLNEFMGSGRGEKIIIFSFFKITLRYLETFLETSFRGQISLLTGDLKPQERWDSIKEFRENPQKKILLSSEVGAEGIDLQFCNALVNYDLPWNPMKIEQRIGRIDRIGQKEKSILIFNFVCKNTIDERIYKKLWERINVFENVLGDIEMLLNESISKLTSKIFSSRLSAKEQEDLINQTADAIARNVKDEQTLENDAGELVAFYDVITENINNARKAGRWVSADDVEFLFLDFFKTNYPGTSFEKNTEESNTYQIKLSTDASDDFRSFIHQNPNLQRPTNFSHERKNKFSFTNKISSRHVASRTEEVDQFHPIIRFAIDESKKSQRQINPLSLCKVKSSVAIDLVGSFLEDCDFAFYYVQRWSFRVLATIENLKYFLISDDGEMLEGIQAESLINHVASSSPSIFKMPNNSATILEINKLAKNEALKLFDQEKGKMLADIVYKAKFQIRAIRENTKRKQTEMEARVLDFKSEQKEKQARMLEGKISKLKERMESRIRQIEDRLVNYSAEYEDVCAGIIIFENV